MSEFVDEWNEGQRVRSERRGRSKDEGGVALVEFAFVALLLFTLIFGILTYGYMISFRQAISQGAAEGARSAAVAPSAVGASGQSTRAVNALNQALSGYGVTCSSGTLYRNGANAGTCTVTILPCANNSSQTCASVFVDYYYRANPLLASIPGLNQVMPEHLRYTAVAEVS